MSSDLPEGAGAPAFGPPMGNLDHGDLGPNTIAAAFTTWTIALVFVSLRIYTRTRIINALGISDWCIGLALVAAGCLCASQVERQ